MIAAFLPCRLHGVIAAPPSKSMAHRYLLGAALSGECCTLSGVDYSEDILATIGCLRALGATVTTEGDTVTVDPRDFMKAKAPVLDCRESGSTLRFFIPLALCLGRPVTFLGAKRLLERPLDVYEELCAERGFVFRREEGRLTLCGTLEGGSYTVRGDVSSQFITGLLLALTYLGRASSIRILPPFESRSYVGLTIAALRSFGADVVFCGADTVELRPSSLHAYSGRIEGDYSNAAFLDAFNRIGSDVTLTGLDPDSLQGDRVYASYFDRIEKGTPVLDISDCPDLFPVLSALAALKNGATFTGTDRLRHKESDRVAAMHAELQRLGGGLIAGENSVTVPRCTLSDRGVCLDGHNDHRIVMAMSLILTRTGGSIGGVEAVAKSYPHFFGDLEGLGAEVTLI